VTTLPRQGSCEGQYGFPIVDGRRLRVFIDGDMPRGVAAWDCDAGWADVLVRREDGSVKLDAAGRFITRRVSGKIEVRKA
jgi:hypothetical protein